MTDSLIEELLKNCTSILIKPHNSNIPSPITISAGCSVKDSDGRFNYATINIEAKTTKEALERAVKVSNGYAEVIKNL